MYVIMRMPVLMEDEGRHFVIKVCQTKEECLSWLDKNATEKDYFKRGDYYITESAE